MSHFSFDVFFLNGTHVLCFLWGNGISLKIGEREQQRLGREEGGERKKSVEKEETEK